MSQYIFILIWLGAMAFLKGLRDLKKNEIVCGKVVRRYPFWFAVLVFAPVIWMAGHRGWIADTGAYIMQYLIMPRSISGLSLYAANIDKDKGFYIFSAVLKLLIGNDYTTYLMILAIIQGISIITIYRKYSSAYVLSIFLFVASTDYISWMFNGLRQFMAVTLIFAATGLMLKKKYIPLIIIILLASTMHQSALIMIPLVFIAQGKAMNQKTMLFIVLALVGIVFIGEFTTILNDSLADTQYKNVMSDAKMFQDDGTNPVRVMIYSIPAVLAFCGRRIIRKANNPVINMCANMSVITMGIYLVSMVTSGIFIGRLPIYISLYSYILLPWEIQHMFTKKTRKIIYIGITGAYLLLYYYQMHMSWGLL